MPQTPPATGAATPGTQSVARTIGEKGKPVRVLAFAGGGFETARQLGVVHALLVTRGEAPHMVIGSSAGAVNAVAAAEILQAGGEEARVARFREIFESYLDCPRDLAHSMFPDTYEIDVHKPLEQLRLPIQADVERENRDRLLNAKAGLLNLYNDLLQLRVSVGTATRFIRRGLGLRAAGAEPRWWKRYLMWIVEGFRTWTLLGLHLAELAPLAGRVTLAAFGQGSDERGAPAAHLIFRSRLFAAARVTGQFSLEFALLVAAWTIVSLLVLTVLALLLHGFSWVVGCEAGLLRPTPALGNGLRELAWPITITAVIDLWIVATAGVIFARKLRAQREPAAKGQARPARRGAIVLGVVFALWSISLSLVTVRIAALTPERGAPGLLAAVVHDAGVAAVATLLAALLVGLVAGGLRQTAQVDELLGSLGAGLGFLGVNGLVLAALIGLGWVNTLWMPDRPLLLLALVLLVLTQGAIFGISALFWCGPVLPVNLLKRYDLANALCSEHPIRQFFVRLFDREYYGRLPMDRVLEQAMQYGDQPLRDLPASPKTLGSYDEPSPPGTYPKPLIHVAIAATDVAAVPVAGTAPLVAILPPKTPVVDGLLAATAIAPFLPPQWLDGKLYLDAANITNEPTGAALDHLRDRVHAQASEIHVYSVTHLPISAAALPAEPGRDYGALIEVVSRAMQLERLRDARLDRNLTHVFTESIPPGRALYQVPRANGTTVSYLRASIFPLEPDSAGHVNRRLLQSTSGAEWRRIIAETVADGCRSAMQSILGDVVSERAAGATDVACRDVVVALQARRKPGKPAQALPGSASAACAGRDPGPGVAEVCQHCTLRRGTGRERARRLEILPESRLAAEWPGQGVPPRAPGGVRRPMDQHWDSTRLKDVAWPRPRGAGTVDAASTRAGASTPPADRSRPTVSLLFSGGVFRGVYQLGVLNALNEAGVRPDIIAGASIGSITAAMIARALTKPEVDIDGRLQQVYPRARRIAQLAAVYLGVDRLVMTDRFADFIRAVTIRAAHTGFSIREADRVFRRYDAPWPGIYGREARRVLAGLERLLYISPFELKEVVEAARRERYDVTDRMVRGFVQEWLNRLGISNQVLGAEPLRLLIEQYVLDQLPAAPSAPLNNGDTDKAFDVFRSRGICFLATVTNLTGGHLEVLGQDQLLENSRPELLGESLLASSAFPGVFRPRWGWEFLPGSGCDELYIDGGVTDNLPLDAVAQFLNQASWAGAIPRRPTVKDGTSVPHLLLATSLEPRLEPLGPDALEGQDIDPRLKRRIMEWCSGQIAQMQNDWPKLSRRASRLKYNLKLDVYAKAQEGLREIVWHDTHTPDGKPKDAEAAYQPLDLEVIAVKPAWLCGTFAFHPMMGFRRQRQAKSIAHGCFTTLVRLSHLYYDGHAEHPKWADAWGLDRERLPHEGDLPHAVLKGDVRARPNPATSDGQCCVRKGRRCPFSRPEAARILGDAAMPQTLEELDSIYRLCCDPSTHLPDNQ
ncbi:MAG: patatin-like phospholipase family protein [Gemmatimonadales bacterium]